LFTDSAEDIDEEDESIGLSDEMKGVYKWVGICFYSFPGLGSFILCL
jgi:hypothetical protein